jgi:hypothetical protein
MDAQTKQKTVAVVSHFPPHRIWMPMSPAQLQRSLPWLHEQVRLDLMRDIRNCPDLRLAKEAVTFEGFKDALHVMWTYLRSGVGEQLHIVRYEVCEVGNTKNVLVQGELEFIPVA